MIRVFNHLLDAKSTQEHALAVSEWLRAPVIPASKDKVLITKNWPRFTIEQSRKPSHLLTFRGEFRNIAVVLGNGLVGVDWDVQDLFEEFLHLNAFTQTTLISQGNRGGTVWLRIDGEHPDKRVDLIDPERVDSDGEPLHLGEWRAAGCCSIIHGPNLIGGFYSHNQKDPVAVTFSDITWPKGVIPPGPKLGTERDREDRIDTDDVVTPRLISSVEAAVSLSTPSGIHQTNQKLFKFCRALKNVELYRGKKFDPAELERAFDLWYAAARPHLRPDQSKDRYQMEFTHKFMTAKHPLGRAKFLERAMERAQSDRPPKAAELFQDERLKRLVSLLYYLQVEAGDQTFFIACRDAGELIGVSKTQANKWLAVLASPLTRHRVLKVVEPGTNTRAPRLRFIDAPTKPEARP